MHRRLVSILVLLDHPLRPPSFGVQWSVSSGVSILVLLDHPLRPVRRQRRKRQGQRVSILVLLDHPLRPCYSPLGRRFCPAGFQSLFCWITHFGLGDDIVIMVSDIEFQSLFCWITHFGHSQQVVVNVPAQRFQSLFCWITHFGLSTTVKRSAGTHRGFNPCSAGSPTSATSFSPTSTHTILCRSILGRCFRPDGILWSLQSTLCRLVLASFSVRNPIVNPHFRFPIHWIQIFR